MVITVQGTRHGDNGAAKLIGAISFFGVINDKKPSLILQFTDKTKNNVENYLIGASLRNESFVQDSSVADISVGMDALFVHSGTQLTKGLFNESTRKLANTSIKNFYDIAFSTSKESFGKEVLERNRQSQHEEQDFIEAFIKAADNAYEYVYVLVDSKNPQLSSKITRLSDINVITIPQGRAEKFIKGPNRNILVVNDYCSGSAFNSKSLMKLYGTKIIYAMMHNVLFNDSCSNGTLLQFLNQNIGARPGDINYDFIHNIRIIYDTIARNANRKLEDIDPDKTIAKYDGVKLVTQRLRPISGRVVFKTTKSGKAESEIQTIELNDSMYTDEDGKPDPYRYTANDQESNDGFEEAEDEGTLELVEDELELVDDAKDSEINLGEDAGQHKADEAIQSITLPDIEPDLTDESIPDTGASDGSETEPDEDIGLDDKAAASEDMGLIDVSDDLIIPAEEDTDNETITEPDEGAASAERRNETPGNSGEEIDENETTQEGEASMKNKKGGFLSLFSRKPGKKTGKSDKGSIPETSTQVPSPEEEDELELLEIEFEDEQDDIGLDDIELDEIVEEEPVSKDIVEIPEELPDIQEEDMIEEIREETPGDEISMIELVDEDEQLHEAAGEETEASPIEEQVPGEEESAVEDIAAEPEETEEVAEPEEAAYEETMPEVPEAPEEEVTKTVSTSEPVPAKPMTEEERLNALLKGL